MGWFRSRSRRTKIIAIQLAIAAGLVVWFVVALPSIEKARAARAAERREQDIQEFFQSMVIDESAAAGAPAASAGTAEGEASSSRRRLKSKLSVAEVEQELGLPNATMTDFRGGQHLTWTGTAHKLDASFDKGTLYALTWTNLRSGHGETVQEWSAQYRKF